MCSMSIPSDTFRYARQWSEVYVETGTATGLSLLAATYARFERMYTCEIDPQMRRIAEVNMGCQFGKIRYFLGDSGTQLTAMLEAAGEKCVVLLDAHVMGEAWDDAEGGCPMRAELLSLENADRSDHLVLVDDVDLCGTPRLSGITFSEVLAALRTVNAGYQFCFLDGIRPKMLLVAAPPGCPMPPHGHPVQIPQPGPH
jgi:hypothetical protein